MSFLALISKENKGELIKPGFHDQAQQDFGRLSEENRHGRGRIQGKSRDFGPESQEIGGLRPISEQYRGNRGQMRGILSEKSGFLKEISKKYEVNFKNLMVNLTNFKAEILKIESEVRSHSITQQGRPKSSFFA